MTARAEITNHLREHIIGALHVGQLSAGDRLPSIREVAQQLGKNARTIKAAYDQLEEEGLVEVRGRSGVFIAPQEITKGSCAGETARWLSHMVTEAWKRRVPVTRLPQLVKQFTASRVVRCALVETVEDAIVALEYELETDWGLEVRIVAPDALDSAGDVDFFVATSFYAATIHAAVENIGKPLVVVTVYSGLKNAIESQIREGRLTVIAVDPRFADRMRLSYAGKAPDRVRFIAATDAQAIRNLDPEQPILLTRAARQKLGDAPAPMIFPHSPTMSPETAQALAATLVRCNAESV